MAPLEHERERPCKRRKPERVQERRGERRHERQRERARLLVRAVLPADRPPRRIQQVGDAHHEEQRERIVRVDPHPADRHQPRGVHAPAGAPRLEHPELRGQQHGHERVGTQVGAQPVEQRAPHQHQQRCGPGRARAPRSSPQQRKRRKRREPAPRLQARDAARGPEGPQRRAEQPRGQRVRRAVAGPRPEVGARDAVPLEQRLAHGEVLPDAHVADRHGDRGQDDGGGHRGNCREPAALQRRKRGRAPWRWRRGPGATRRRPLHGSTSTLRMPAPCWMWRARSSPRVTRAKIVYLPSRCGCGASVMNHWLPPVSLPDSAMPTMPAS